MLRRMSLMGAVLSVLLLTGCTPSPNQLGLSAQQWQAMNEQQRQQILQGYDKVQQAHANATVYAGPKIVVSLSRGLATMPPFTQALPYQPVQFALKPGECTRITLKSLDGNHQADLPACYNGLTLALDPSRYDPLLSGGSLRFNYIPIWKRGFAYNGVSSQGYVHLTEVKVIINAIAQTGDATSVVSQPRTDLQTEPLQKIIKTQPTTELTIEPLTVPAIELKTEPQAESEWLEQISEKKLAPVEDIENISH